MARNRSEEHVVISVFSMTLSPRGKFKSEMFVPINERSHKSRFSFDAGHHVSASTKEWSCVHTRDEPLNLLLNAATIRALLLIGGVEANPGPCGIVGCCCPHIRCVLYKDMRRALKDPNDRLREVKEFHLAFFDRDKFQYTCKCGHAVESHSEHWSTVVLGYREWYKKAFPELAPSDSAAHTKKEEQQQQDGDTNDGADWWSSFITTCMPPVWSWIPSCFHSKAKEE